MSMRSSSSSERSLAIGSQHRLPIATLATNSKGSGCPLATQVSAQALQRAAFGGALQRRLARMVRYHQSQAL